MIATFKWSNLHGIEQKIFLLADFNKRDAKFPLYFFSFSFNINCSHKDVYNNSFIISTSNRIYLHQSICFAKKEDIYSIHMFLWIQWLGPKISRQSQFYKVCISILCFYDYVVFHPHRFLTFPQKNIIPVNGLLCSFDN